MKCFREVEVTAETGVSTALRSYDTNPPQYPALTEWILQHVRVRHVPRFLLQEATNPSYLTTKLLSRILNRSLQNRDGQIGDGLGPESRLIGIRCF